MILESAYALAEYTAARYQDERRVYPPISELQEVSIRVATRIIECAFKQGVAGRTKLSECDCNTYVRSRCWHPRYIPFVRGTFGQDD